MSGLQRNQLGYRLFAPDHAGLTVLHRLPPGQRDRCARPSFAVDRLRKEGDELVYRCAKQRSESSSDKRGTKADELHLTPLELIDRNASLVPPLSSLFWCAGTEFVLRKGCAGG